MKAAMLVLGNTGDVATHEHAPVWVPDQDSSTCSLCSTTFNLFRRRHHCRACGALVCAEHSKKRMILESVNAKQKQRICWHIK